MRFKVGIIGAGNVGAEAASEIQTRQIADVVLVDIIEGLPQGKALDMTQASPIYGISSRVTGSNNYQAIEGADVVVLTAGLARKPGMSREDLLITNFNIVKGVSEKIREFAPQSILIVVTNPLDAMVYTAYRVTGFPPTRVMGMAGALDTARFRAFIAMELGVSFDCVQAIVLGSHGDLMVPVVRYAAVSGIPATELIPRDRLDAIINRTRQGGGEIVALLKTGSAYYAPGVAITEMVESILWDEKRLISACTFLNGQYGIKDVFVGVPIILGKEGVEKILELPLSPDELTALSTSAQHVRDLMKQVDTLFGG